MNTRPGNLIKTRPHNLPIVTDVANRFCEIVIQWGMHDRPEYVRALITGSIHLFPATVGIDRIAPPHRRLVCPDDVCDPDMAMELALDELGVGPFEIDEHPDWYNDFWDECHSMAASHGFLPTIGMVGLRWLVSAQGDMEVVDHIPEHQVQIQVMKKGDVIENLGDNDYVICLGVA